MTSSRRLADSFHDRRTCSIYCSLTEVQNCIRLTQKWVQRRFEIRRGDHLRAKKHWTSAQSPKKHKLGGRVPPRCTPKGTQISFPNVTKTVQNQERIAALKKRCFWTLFENSKVRCWRTSCIPLGHKCEDLVLRELIMDF